MDTLIYGDETRTILLRMKRLFQIYLIFIENINNNYEQQPESGSKCLNKCRFYMVENNRSWRTSTLQYEIDFKIFGLLT